mgnify:FL=1
MPGAALISWFLLGNAQAQETPCLTPTLMSQWGEKPIMKNYPTLPPAPAKAERDAWGDWPNSTYSENFVVKWGTDSISSQKINALLEAFEAAWSVQVDDMEYDAPVGTKDYRFNVYIAESGPNSLNSYGAAGYFSYDHDGWPMIVIAKASLSAPDDGAGTAVHEFFHAVQDAMGTWEYTGEGGWYYEATACWIVPEVLPNDLTYLSFILGYGLLPNYPVNFFDYWDTGAFTEYHHYGAFIFPRYLTEKVFDWELIRDSWRENNFSNDPLLALEELIEARGGDFEQIFSDFAAHNATWDYEHGDYYQQYVDYYADQFPQWDCRVSDALGKNGDGDWREANSACLPQRYGYNLIELKNPKKGHLALSFRGDEKGSMNTDALWKLQFVREGGTQEKYVPLDFEGVEADLALCDVGDESSIYLVVSSHSPTLKSGEVFDYSYKLERVDSHPLCGGEPEPEDTSNPDPDPDPEPEDTSNPDTTPGGLDGLTDEPGGCACSAGPASPGAPGLFFAGLFSTIFWSRRRGKS